MIYHFRIILDTEEDVFRDMEIEAAATMEDFHNAITQTFGFSGDEMASFFVSNEEWDQGEEIVLFDMGEEAGEPRMMRDTLLQDLGSDDELRFIYIYDFLHMWTILIERTEIKEAEADNSYPKIVLSIGQVPDEAPLHDFVVEDLEETTFEEEDFDLDPEDYENLDFDENWN